MTTNTKTSKSGTIEVVPSDPAEDRENAIDRLAGLLPRDELEDALKASTRSRSPGRVACSPSSRGG